MIVIDELPFSIVDGDGFKNFCSIACPRFELPSRRSLVRDIKDLYRFEKKCLKSYFESTKQRVSLTTDCWTSIQNVNYMCVTAHYVDADWCLQKRIISFRVITNHKGDSLGRELESVLQDWGIDRVFSITLDNATSNTSLVAYLKKKMKMWKTSVLDCEYLHVRCSAHILNLIVGDGLKNMCESVAAVRNSVRYVKSSPARLDKFRDCMKAEKMESKALLCLDVPTRWNSTYLMLESAIKFKAVFDRLEEEDVHFKLYFAPDDFGKKREGPPDSDAWDEAKLFVSFLKGFYDVTLKFSSSLQVTSHLFFHYVAAIERQLQCLSLHNKPAFADMAKLMQEKFKKYWGPNGLADMNKILIVATVLDPRKKLEYVAYCYGLIKDRSVASDLTNGIKLHLVRLYNWYCEFEVASSPDQTNAPVASFSEGQCNAGDVGVGDSANEFFAENMEDAFYKQMEHNQREEIKNDVERYLADRCETSHKDFDILKWWKVNAHRYPTLSLLARDVFGIQVSTVASESAFSTGGRILDPFRSSLTADMVEKLICYQNWLNSTPSYEKSFLAEIELYEQIEKDLATSPPTKPTSTASANPTSIPPTPVTPTTATANPSQTHPIA